MISVSHSKIKTWRRCRKAFAYKYIEHLEPRRKERPLVFGSIAHEMIEANANGDLPQDIIAKYRRDAKKLFSAEREDYLQIVDDAELVMYYYFKYYQNDKLKFVSIKGKKAEHEFEVDLCRGIILKGKIDAIMKDSRDRIWLGEHKSHKEMPNDNTRFLDLQTVIYTEILQDIGIKRSDGVLWDYIRSVAPKKPQLLKTGELSQKKIDTLHDVYLEEIKRHNLDARDYKTILKKLVNKERDYFQRVFMPNNQKLSDQLLRETIITAKEMAEKGGKDQTRNISKDCSWCSYRNLCKAELLGLDVNYIRKKEFVNGKKTG